MRPPLAFAVLLIALAAIQVIFAVHALPLLLPVAGAAFVCGFALIATRGAARPPERRAIAEASPGAALAGVGAVIAVAGIQLGAWCLLLGIGLGLAGLALAIREHRDEERR